MLKKLQVNSTSETLNSYSGLLKHGIHIKSYESFKFPIALGLRLNFFFKNL